MREFDLILGRLSVVGAQPRTVSLIEGLFSKQIADRVMMEKVNIFLDNEMEEKELVAEFNKYKSDVGYCLC